MGKTAESDNDLFDGLKAAKSKRCHFVLVLKGGTDGALLVSKTKIPPVAIAAAKKSSGGSAVVRGLVSYKDGVYNFETAKIPPATAAQAVKKIAKRDAELSIHAVFRFSTDPELAALGEAEPLPGPVLPGADGQAAAAQPSGSATNGDLLAQWKAKLSEWSPAIKQALADKAPNAPAIGKLLAQAVALSKPGGDMVQALAKLTECHSLVASSAGPDNFQELYNGLLETIPADVRRLRAVDAATAERIQKVVDAAAAHAANNAFEKAFEFLSTAAEVLAKAAAAARTREAAAAIPEGKVAAMTAVLRQAQSKWDAALTMARGRLKPAQVALQANFPATAVGLKNILDSYEQDLLLELQAGQAKTDEMGLEAALQATLAKVQSLRAEAESDDVFSYLAECGVKVKDAFNLAFDEVEDLLQV